MNPIMQNDIEFDIYVREQIERDDITEEEKNQLIRAKIENELASKEKAGNMIRYIDYCEMQAQGAKYEKDKYAKIQKYYEGVQERIKDAAFKYLKSKGWKKLETDFRSFKITTSKRLIVDDKNIVPSKYIKIEPEVRVMEAKTAINRGEDVPGCHIEEHENIRIE